MLNVHHLELFYHVARAGGITAALREIPYGIQQPAVSLQMSQLEDSVGTQLFVRRPFSLTPAGREIYDFIMPFFSGLPQLSARVRGQAAQQLRLAASGMVMRDHFPWVMREMQRRIPGLRMTSRDTGYHGPSQLLRSHEADIVLGVMDPGEAEGLRFELLVKLPIVLLVEASSAFRTAAQVLREAARRDLPLISSLAPDAILNRFQAELRQRGQEWKVSFEVPGIDVVEAYVAQGFGVGLSIASPGHTLTKNVRVLRLSDFPEMPYCAFWLDRLSGPALICLEVIRARARGVSASS